MNNIIDFDERRIQKINDKNLKDIMDRIQNEEGYLEDLIQGNFNIVKDVYDRICEIGKIIERRKKLEEEQ